MLSHRKSKVLCTDKVSECTRPAKNNRCKDPRERMGMACMAKEIKRIGEIGGASSQKAE